MIEIHIATLFPDMVMSAFSESIIKRAMDKGLLSIQCHYIRDYTTSKQGRVDDAPYGGGMGMVLQAEPIYRLYEAVCAGMETLPHVIYLSPQGKVLTQKRVKELSLERSLLLICGHYEGVDERLIEEIVDEEISIGDFVLTGGEIPAMALCDAVCRLVPGVLSDAVCHEEESHSNGALEYPQYTHPREFRGREVPEVLLSGHHENIRKFRRRESLLRTREKRPDLFGKISLSDEDKKLLEE